MARSFTDVPAFCQERRPGDWGGWYGSPTSVLMYTAYGVLGPIYSLPTPTSINFHERFPEGIIRVPSNLSGNLLNEEDHFVGCILVLTESGVGCPMENERHRTTGWSACMLSYAMPGSVYGDAGGYQLLHKSRSYWSLRTPVPLRGRHTSSSCAG